MRRWVVVFGPCVPIRERPRQDATANGYCRRGELVWTRGPPRGDHWVRLACHNDGGTNHGWMLTESANIGQLLKEITGAPEERDVHVHNMWEYMKARAPLRTNEAAYTELADIVLRCEHQALEDQSKFSSMDAERLKRAFMDITGCTKSEHLQIEVSFWRFFSCRCYKAYSDWLWNQHIVDGDDTSGWSLSDTPLVALPAGAAAQLEDGNIVIVDSWVSPDAVAEARAEAEALHAEGKLNEPEQHDQFVHRRDRIVWLKIKECRSEGMRAVQRALRSTAGALVADGLTNAPLLVPKVSALTRFGGDGGLYAEHMDSSGDDPRRVTAILFLRDDWTEGDGGELVARVGGDVWRTVAPVGGRLVLFLSRRVKYEIQPVHRRPLFMVTLWLLGDGEGGAVSPISRRATAQNRNQRGVS